jgi:hypothetical protein
MSPKHPSAERIRPVSALDAGLRVIGFVFQAGKGKPHKRWPSIGVIQSHPM